MFWVSVQHPTICALGTFVLQKAVSKEDHKDKSATYIFLLFVHMANLEPDVFFVQRPRRVLHDVLEALSKVSRRKHKRELR
jgi:hypothetical protein